VDTVFLLGSGISIDAGMPDVTKITEQVVSGDGAMLHTNQHFVIDADHPSYECRRSQAEPVLELIQDIRCLATQYFKRERDPNYEEISQVVREIGDSLSGEYPSPAVLPLIRQLLHRPYSEASCERLRKLSQLAHDYIRDTVRHMLKEQPVCVSHLGVIVEACEELPSVTLATLNHDLVLERALEGANLAYTDGFEILDEDVRYWRDAWGDGPRLLKLHGSLDWWSYRHSDEPWRGWDTGRFRGEDPMNPNRPEIVDVHPDMRPIFLTGTFDKILAYETSVFPDQHFRFHEALKETERIVVIGYGFGDKAINSRLIGWTASSPKRRLVVCHPDEAKLVKDARGAIQNNWMNWQNDGRLNVIAAYVADLNYEAIAKRLPGERPRTKPRPKAA